MSLYSAFYSGLSGLATNANALNVIGNNLSNINTVGFKGSSTTFRDIFSTSLGGVSTQGNGNPIQFGLGVQVNSVSQDFSQSSFQSTGNALDMAIQGSGYFVLNDGQKDVYTRVGGFAVDSEYYLVDPATGYRVQRIGSEGLQVQPRSLQLRLEGQEPSQRCVAPGEPSC